MHKSKDKVWNIVKQVKAQMYFHYGKIMAKVIAVEEKLKIGSLKSVFKNISREQLRTAHELLIYLIITKPESTTGMWLEFFRNLFENESANHIILTLNRIMRKSENKSNYKINEKLFRKATTLLKLNNQEIQSLMPGESKNVTTMGAKSLIMKGKHP